MSNDFARLKQLDDEIKRIQTITYLITFGVGIIASILMISAGAFPLILFLLFLCVPISIIISESISKPQREERDKIFKYGFVKTALSGVFDDLSFAPDNGFQEEFLKDTKMIDIGDRFSSNDLVTGTYKGMWFSQSDVHIEEKHTSTDSKGQESTSYSTLFKGRFIVFDFNKKFSSNFLVVQKRTSGYTVPGSCFKGTKFKKYTTEDESFNNRFHVYCQDVMAPYNILTPSFIEKLKTVDDKNNGGLIICFIEDRLYIGINDKSDAFELDLNKTPTEEKMVRKIMNEIHVITDLLDDILTDNIGFLE